MLARIAVHISTPTVLAGNARGSGAIISIEYGRGAIETTASASPNNHVHGEEPLGPAPAMPMGHRDGGGHHHAERRGLAGPCPATPR